MRDRTLALAGVFQAAFLVKQLAHDGRADANVFASSARSILTLDAGTTEEVFGGPNGVQKGLELLNSNFSGSNKTLEVEVARYVIAMLHLSGQLARRTDLQEAIRRGIESAEEKMKFFEPSDDNVHPTLVEKLAEVYVQTLSTLSPAKGFRFVSASYVMTPSAKTSVHGPIFLAPSVTCSGAMY